MCVYEQCVPSPIERGRVTPPTSYNCIPLKYVSSVYLSLEYVQLTAHSALHTRFKFNSMPLYQRSKVHSLKLSVHLIIIYF